jgi:hypothetical protein
VGEKDQSMVGSRILVYDVSWELLKKSQTKFLAGISFVEIEKPAVRPVVGTRR